MRNKRHAVPVRTGRHHPDLRLDVTTDAILYERFSHPDQGKEGRDSSRRQKSRGEMAAEHHGLTIRRDITAADLGVSSYRRANFEKGALGALKTAFQNGTIQRYTKVITETIDRITRASDFEANDAFQDLLRVGMIIVTADDLQVWSADNMGRDGRRHVLASKLGTANLESSLKSQRVGEAWERAQQEVAAGKRRVISSICPGWLKANREEDRYEPIPHRVATLNEMFRMRLDGLGREGIARDLNLRAVPTFGREEQGLRDWRQGQHWHPTTVGKLLTNAAVIGHWQGWWWEETQGADGKWTRKRVPSEYRRDDVFPEVVDPAIFYAVQRLLEKERRGAARGGGRVETVTNLFAGVATCGGCGHRLTSRSEGYSRGKNQLMRSVLMCDAYMRGKTTANGRRVCGVSTRWRLNPLEESVLAMLGLIATMDEAPSDDPKVRDMENRLARLTGEVERNTKAVADLALRIADPNATPAVVTALQGALDRISQDAGKAVKERDDLAATLPAVREGNRQAAAQKALGDLIGRTRSDDEAVRVPARIQTRTLLRQSGLTVEGIGDRLFVTARQGAVRFAVDRNGLVPDSMVANVRGRNAMARAAE